MDMIELYTREVGRRLPEKMRADIEREIRSLIEDNLEDESRAAGRPADEEMVAAVLKRMGPPEKMAASYLPPRYLIGPELFPHYLNSLRIVLAVVAVLAALALGAGVGAGAATPFEAIGRIVSGLLDAMFRAAAIVTLVFAIIQLASPGLGLRVKEAEWDPRKLQAEPDPERVSIPGAVAEIVTSTVALVVFNFYPHWIGLNTLVNGEWTHAGLLTEAFFGYLPFLNAVWALEIGRNAWLAAQGRWTPQQRWAEMVLSALTVGVLAWMLSGPALVGLDPAEASRLGWGLSPETVAQINEGLATSVRVVLGLVIALQVLELGQQALKLVRGRLPAPLVLE
jgi:hypothetical protein